MATLKSKTISSGVDDILTVDGGIGTGNTSHGNMKTVEDGNGTASPIKVSTTQVHINATADATAVDNESGALIVGNTSAEHIAVDGNEIMARNGTSGATNLNLNHEGGTTRCGGNLQINNQGYLLSGTDMAVGAGYYQWYVSTSGDDGNVGTSSSPLATIREAIERTPLGGYANIRLEPGTASNAQKIYYMQNCKIYNKSISIHANVSAGNGGTATQARIKNTIIRLNQSSSGTAGSYSTLGNCWLHFYHCFIEVYSNNSNSSHYQMPFTNSYGRQASVHLGAWVDGSLYTGAEKGTYVEFKSDLRNYNNTAGQAQTNGVNCFFKIERGTGQLTMSFVDVKAKNPGSAGATPSNPDNMVFIYTSGKCDVTADNLRHSNNLTLINGYGASQFHSSGNPGIHSTTITDGSTTNVTSYVRAGASWATVIKTDTSVEY